VGEAVVLIDREQGGGANLSAAGVQLHAAMTFSQLLEALHQAERIDSVQHQRVQNYLAAMKN
jgi:orotate phosphoribosyltransferase